MRKKGANPDYRAIITGKRWTTLRGMKMLMNAIDNGGFCERCVKLYRAGGPRPREATEVHHIVPIESGHTRQEMEALAYDENNLMALCSQCHHELHKELGRVHIKEALREEIDEYLKSIRNGRQERTAPEQPGESFEGHGPS